ncbi:MAG TPA: hypothetical protein VF642_03385 [Propionibacteriaceae bacterium]|jgi:hypothetical protein
MDDWTRLYVEAELIRAGYEPATWVAEAFSGESSVVAVEAERDGIRSLSAFSFETLDSGERLPTGHVILPYPAGGTAVTTPTDPWLVFGTWPDLDPEYHVMVGRLRDRTARTCSAVSPGSTEQLSVTDGVVVGWVDSSPQLLYETA